MPPARNLAQKLEHHLSAARLLPYRSAVGGDLDRALALYAWNTLAAGAFFEDLGHLEVFLRNALHLQLVAWHARAYSTGEWYDDPGGVLAAYRHRDIAEARGRVARNRQQVETPGRVVAELTFGFWRSLLDKRYQTTLWAPALRHAFPHLSPQNRTLVHDPLQRLHRLRNRIAHHEPIHREPLAAHHADVILIAGFIDPDLGAWLSVTSRVPSTLAARP